MLVDIPKDLQAAEIDFAWPPVVDLPGYKPNTKPHNRQVREAAKLIAAARKVIVVADHTKWGVVGLSTIAPLERVDVLVTDAQLDVEARRLVKDKVGQLIVAKRDDTPGDQADG